MAHEPLQLPHEAVQVLDEAGKVDKKQYQFDPKHYKSLLKRFKFPATVVAIGTKFRGVMKIYSLVFLGLAIFSSSVLAQIKKGESSLPTVPGWRLPTTNDIKQQWSEKYWNDECHKYADANKKAKNDAVENFGSGETQKVKPEASPPKLTTESDDEKDECWKPDFPTHVAFGDYDGDGSQDEARILISRTRPTVAAIFVFLKGAKTMAVRVTEPFELRPPQNYWISTQPPSDEEIKTACYEGRYWDCRPGEPSSITLKRDALIFGQFESWSAIAYLDSRLNKFKVVQLSD